MGAWNETSHDHSAPDTASGTNITLTTAEVPFFHFLGKSRFEFYSNDTTVLGVKNVEQLRKKQKPSEAESGKPKLDWGVDLGYSEFDAGEHRFDIFNFNYDTSTDSAWRKEIVLEAEHEADLGQYGSVSAEGSITCKNCYMYAG